MVEKLIVGIDIGQRDTKVVVLEKKSKLALAEAFLFPTPFIAGQVEDRRVDAEKFKHAFNQSFSWDRLRSARIAINLPAASITALLVQMPLLPPKELMFAALNEARQKMIPHSGPSHIFDCLYLGDRAYDQIVKSEVLVVRSEKKYVENVLGVFDKNEIAPSLIVPPPFVVSGLLPKDAWKKDEDIAFVEMGACYVNFFICRESKLVFHRSIALGMGSIIRDLANKLEVDPLRMEQVVNDELGVPQVDFNLEDKVALAEEIMRQKYESGGSPSAQGVVQPLELRMHWQPHLDRIIQEFRRSLAYYKDQSRGRRVEAIYFLGGCCRVKNFVSTLKPSIGGQCQELLPFKNLQITGTKFSPDNPLTTPVFADAVSLAYATQFLKDRKLAPVNFLPEELRKQESQKLLQWMIVCGLLILSVLAAVSLTVIMANNVMLKDKIRGVEFELTRVKEKQLDVQSIVEKEQRIQERKAAIDAVRAGRKNTLALMRALTDVLPRGVLLKKVVFTSTTLEADAQITADFEEGQALVDELEASMKADARFANVVVSSLELETISAQAFVDAQGERLTAAKTRDFKIKAELTGQ